MYLPKNIILFGNLSSFFLPYKNYIIGAVIFLFIFASANIYLNLLPKNELFSYNIPSSYHIALIDNSPIDKQSPYMCAGYSASFIKQYYNYLDSSGQQSYQQMSYSLPFLNGVPPFRLVNYLNRNKFYTSFYRGNLNNLFAHIVNERPVIVLVGNGLSWQHYIVLLGYDINEELLYFYDPEIPYLPGNNNITGNRVLSFEEFKNIWANGLPLYNHLYIPGNYTGL